MFVPNFETTCTKAWNRQFQSMVLPVPKFGIVCSKAWYSLFQNLELLLVRVSCLYLCLGDLLLVDAPPAVGAVGDDDGDEERHPGHDTEGDLTAASIADREAALQVDVRRIEGGVVPTGNEEQHRHHEDDTDAFGPDAFDILLVEDRPADAEEHEQHADEEDDEQRPHRQEVVEILHRFHEDDACRGVHGISVFEQGADEEGEEEDEEERGVVDQSVAAALPQRLVGDVVAHVEQTGDAGEEEHSEAEDDIPHVEERVETIAGIGPVTDDRLDARRDVCFLNVEVAAVEECCHGAAKKQRTYDAVDDEADLEDLRTEEVAELVLKFIAHGLHHEGEEDEHPDPIGSSKARTVEQGEGGEEGGAEGGEGSEGELPFVAGGVDDETALLRCPAEAEDETVAALHKEEEHEEGSHERDDEPPVLL